MIEIFESTILNLICIDKPYIVLVILEELSMHLENLNLSHFLKVVAHFEALYVTVLFKLAVLEQFILIFNLEGLIVNLLRSILIITRVNRSSELDRNIVIFLRIRKTHTSLNVVHNLLLR